MRPTRDDYRYVPILMQGGEQVYLQPGQTAGPPSASTPPDRGGTFPGDGSANWMEMAGYGEPSGPPPPVPGMFVHQFSPDQIARRIYRDGNRPMQVVNGGMPEGSDLHALASQLAARSTPILRRGRAY